MGLVRRHEVIGLEVRDRDGAFVGTVRDTHPLDGGGEMQFLLIGVGRRFAHGRYVPAEGIEVGDGEVHLPVSRVEIEDCPPADDSRWGHPADLARGYWVLAGD